MFRFPPIEKNAAGIQGRLKVPSVENLKVARGLDLKTPSRGIHRGVVDRQPAPGRVAGNLTTESGRGFNPSDSFEKSP